MKPPWHTTMSKFSKTLYFSLGRWGSQERMAGVAFCFFLIPAFLVHNCLPQCLGYNTVFFKKIFISYANWLYIYLCDRGFFICLFCFVYKAPCIISSLNLQALYWKVESFSSVQFSSVTQSYSTLCDPMNRSTPGLPIHHQLPEFTQTHVHRVSDAIQPSHPLSSPSPPAPNPSQHQSFFQ